MIHGFSALYSGVKEFLNVSASCAGLFFNQSNQSVCFALNFGEITSRGVSGFAVNVFRFFKRSPCNVSHAQQFPVFDISPEM